MPIRLEPDCELSPTKSIGLATSIIRLDVLAEIRSGSDSAAALDQRAAALVAIPPPHAGGVRYFADGLHTLRIVAGESRMGGKLEARVDAAV